MQSPKAQNLHYSIDYPETPRPAKTRMQLTPDGKQILIPSHSSTNQVSKIPFADLLPLPHLTVDSE